MLAALFRSNKPAVLLLVPLVVAALFAPAFRHPPPAPDELMPLAALVQAALGPSGWAQALAGCVLIGLVAVQLAVLLNALELHDRRNHLAAVAFPVLQAGLGGPWAYEPALLGMPFVLLALRRTWSISNTGPALGALFDAALLIGLAALCYLPYALVLAVAWASTSLLRPFAWREYALPVVALAVVGWIAWAVLHLLGQVPWHPLLTVAPSDAAAAPAWSGAAHRAFLAVLAPVLLLALAALGRSHAGSVMRGKNLRSAFTAFALAMAMTMALLQALFGAWPAVIPAVPAAVLIGYLFLEPKRPWLAEAALAALVLAALWVRWS